MFKKFVVLGLILISLYIPFKIFAATVPAGDEALFTSVAPDALILMDVSGSMSDGPAGGWYSHDSNCQPDTTNCNYTDCSSGYCKSQHFAPPYGSEPTNCYNACDNNYGHDETCAADVTNCTGTDCKDGYCMMSKTNCSTNCSRIRIAKKAIFSILDKVAPKGTIDSQDSTSLGIRVGFMSFGGADSALDYTSGNIILRTKISTLGATDLGTSYQKLYCGSETSCTTYSSSDTNSVAGQTASGGTPLANALMEAKKYLYDHEVADKKASDCRQKFVILISDGADTYACSGNGTECQTHMYKRRRLSVAAAKQLNDAGYKVYVIGFGASMPTYLKNTLNWMAYYGGTDSPDVNNVGTNPYSIATGCNPDGTAAERLLCCDMSTNPTACFPSVIQSCYDDTSGTSADATYCDSTKYPNFVSASGTDPGYATIEGYAFLASDTTQLTDSLRAVMWEIYGQSYSFSSASIQTIRVRDEQYLYEASFSPQTTPLNDSFWPGYLKRYSIIDSNGNINTTPDWDAGEVLSLKSAADRKVWTLKSGTITEFTGTNFSSPDDFGITGSTSALREATRQLVINYIRGGESITSKYPGWKLGDIFHSDPITIGTPSLYFYDRIDQQATTGFETFRDNHKRTTENEKRLIIAGANDAQFHVFKAANPDKGGGSEVWSFIPPNFLTRLQAVAHSTHPTACLHQYFVDGSPTVADVWWGSDQTAKADTDWHTLLVLSEGRGGYTKSWSSTAGCDTGLSDDYSAASPYYCGYYAFDVSDTSQTTPSPLWKLGGTSALSAAHGSHLGEPWSKMSTGRVLYSGLEKWVGFLGGGYEKANCSGGGTCEPKGKGFYVVDVSNGNILWTMTRNGPSGTYDNVHTSMNYALSGQAATLDFDNDGFIDTAYIADIGGNIWRFKFCLKSDTACTPDKWSGSLLYDSSGNVRPIFTKPAVSRDPLGNVWVYFGSGDATDPTASNDQERFYAVIDTLRTGTYELKDLLRIYSDSTDPSKHFDVNNPGTKHGWYEEFASLGLKVLGDPVVAYGVLYFTAFGSNTSNLCDKTGTNYLWGVGYTSGAGQFAGGSPIGGTWSGPPTNPQFSIDDTTGKGNLYIGKEPTPLAKGSSGGRSNLLYWRDNRVKP